MLEWLLLLIVLVFFWTLYFVLLLFLSAYRSKLPFVNVRNSNKSPSQAERLLVSVVHYAALITGTVAIVYGFSLFNLDWRLTLAFSLLTGLTLAIVLRTGALFTARRFKRRTLDLLAPVVRLFSIVSSLPGLSHVLALADGNGDSARKDAEEMIKEGLELLEDSVGLPHGDNEWRMIRNILRMDDVKVKEIMRPRPDVVAVSVETSLEKVAALMTECSYSRLPVYREDLDDMEGIVYSKDLIDVFKSNGQKEKSLSDIMRDVLLVPETQNLEVLLNVFREERSSIAVVVDEHGGVVGIVTVTDLAEQIFGEMMDEFDDEPPEIEILEESSALIDAGITVDQLNQTLGTHVDGSRVDTVGGILYRERGVPNIGDTVRIENVELTVEGMSGRRIKRIRAVKEAEQQATTTTLNGGGS